MTSTNDSDLKVAARRQASFLKRSEPVHEFANGKLVILAAIFFITLFGLVALLMIR